jgi:hypothetical protein
MIAPTYPEGYPKPMSDVTARVYILACEYCGHRKGLAWVRPGTLACLDWKACDARDAKLHAEEDDD